MGKGFGSTNPNLGTWKRHLGSWSLKYGTNVGNGFGSIDPNLVISKGHLGSGSPHCGNGVGKGFGSTNPKYLQNQPAKCSGDCVVDYICNQCGNKVGINVVIEVPITWNVHKPLHTAPTERVCFVRRKKTKNTDFWESLVLYTTLPPIP